MADFSAEHEIVTKSLLDTCQLRQGLKFNAITAWIVCRDSVNVLRASFDDETELIPVLTGSAAELYIEPMLSCVGDYDTMFHTSDNLAIPAGTAPPTQLPDDFNGVVVVHEITDSEFPGYVYLVSSYLLAECVDEGKYNAFECQRRYHVYETQDNSHGPAVVAQGFVPHIPWFGRLAGSRLSIDQVYCCRCLSWPTQAADWPTRYRNYGWPDSATVDSVVSHGCDVVCVAHRQCRQDERINKTKKQKQWRLSFSRAEIVLLNSWIPVQQILYHMLRVFVKTERLRDSAK